MATQNVTIAGVTYSAVPSVTIPKQGGGTAKFVEVTDTTAVAADVAEGKYFYTASGNRVQGTNQGGIIPSGTINITSTGSYNLDVTSYATAAVNIPMESVSRTFTPNGGSQSTTVSPGAGYSGLSSVNITVDAIPSPWIVPTGDVSITANGSGIDVSTYATATVSVDATIENKTISALSSTVTSITFTGLTKKPKMWACQIMINNGSYISGATTRYITSCLCLGGTNIYSTCLYKSGSTAREYEYTTCTWSYNNGSLTITSPGTDTAGGFRNGSQYRIFCAY